MLSKATSSVSSMLETVETQLGIPSPTDMAKLATASKSSNDDEPLKVINFNRSIIQIAYLGPNNLSFEKLQA